MKAKTFGDLVRDGRVKAGISQRALGERLGGLGQSTISAWECGNARPELDSLVDLADILHLDLEQLVLAARVWEPPEDT